jgi:hypothetical protein
MDTIYQDNGTRTGCVMLRQPRRYDARMKTATQIRRENLRFVIDTYFGGVRSKAQAAFGMTTRQQLTNLLNPDGRKGMGNELARKIEKAVGLPDGWMDYDRAPAEDIAQSEEELTLLKHWRSLYADQRRQLIRSIHDYVKVNEVRKREDEERTKKTFTWSLPKRDITASVYKTKAKAKKKKADI